MTVAVADHKWHQWVTWWTKGSDGEPGKGGWQKQFPMNSLRSYFALIGVELPTLSTMDFDRAVSQDPPSVTHAGRPLPLDNPMTSADVSRELGCSATTVHALVARGLIRSKATTSGLRIFDPADVATAKANGVFKKRGEKR